MKRRIFSILRAVATLALLGVIALRTDPATIRRAVAAADPAFIGLAVALMLMRNLLQASRWRSTLAAWCEQVPLRELLRLVLVGNFFTLLLPTSAGGDVARWSMLSRPGRRRMLAAQSVVADRLLGLIGLGIVVLVALPWTWPLLPGGAWRAGLLLILPVTVGGLAAVLEPRWVPESWRRRWRLERVRRHRHVAAGLGMAMLVHAAAVGAVVALGRAVGDTTGIALYATLLPLVWLLSMLPIAIGGLGVREAGFMTLFVAVGMEPGLAAAIAALWLGMTLAQAALGGLILLRGRRVGSGAATGDHDQGGSPAMVPTATGEPGLPARDELAEQVHAAR